MKRVLFIYNRHAGKNKTWAGLSNIINAMTEEDCLVTAYPTQYRGDAGEAIVRWNKDFDQVVVAGRRRHPERGHRRGRAVRRAAHHRLHPRGDDE